MRKSTAAVLGIWVALSLPSAAAALGEQTFLLLFKAGDVLWIGEDIGGEYKQSILHQVVLADTTAAAGQTVLKAFKEWTAVTALRNHLETEPAIELARQADGVWTHRTLTWTVTAPPEETALSEAFDRHVAGGGSDARSFYAAPDAPQRHSPSVKGATATPLFYSARGLFFNYRIASAHYFPRSGLLLVFIDQPVKAVGLDTMHGFVLLNIHPQHL